MAIEVISEIKQKNNLKFPLLDSNNIRGGLYLVKSQIEMENFPLTYLKPGTLCYVLEREIFFKYSDDKKWHVYDLKLPDIPQNDIPILDQDMIRNIQETDPTKLPEKYIELPKDNGLSGEVVNNTYTTTNNGNYIDILFSAIRTLQSEVARLKNSFKYGINSYNDDKTAMSESLGAIKNPDEEPLWAVEEDSLSELHDCTITTEDYNSLLFGDDIKADLKNDELIITGSAIFNDPPKPKTGFKIQPDPKSFIFLTSTGKDISFNLKSLNTYDNFRFNLNQFDCRSVEKYNILIIVSKKTTKSKTDLTLYGEDYIWIQISDYKTDEILTSGYYNKSNKLSSIKYLLNDLYYIDSIEFNDLTLSKFNTYTKYQDFSLEVIPTYPDDSDYKFGAAHLTIRSIKNESIKEKVSNYLLDGELVWVENTKKLYIKSKNQIVEIGSNSKHNDDDMTTEELIGMLKNLGIVVAGKENDYSLELNNLTGITFIHQDTGKKFNIEIDSEGNLRSTLEDNNTLKSRIENAGLITNTIRGFISNLLISEKNKKDNSTFEPTLNAGLNSDRLKIGAIYAPKPGRSVYGCSHAYVELENTSNSDFNLKDCYLYVAYKDENKNLVVKQLPLTGTIPAGGTYLIRGKKYAEFEDKNTVLKVKTYDLEWYVDKKLIDFQREALNFLLIYNVLDVTANKTFINLLDPKKKTWKIDNPGFIDFAPVRDIELTYWHGNAPWKMASETTDRDYILKNTFELDPARQAFLALNPADSSRTRGKSDNDFKPFYIDVPTISFPHSEETYDVSKYTPKASFEHKNISTDKSKLDTEKPNMVYCSFGIDMHKTRCFNWISVGSFDEYIWVRQKGTQIWEKFESYKDDSVQTGTIFNRKVESGNFLNCIYKRMQGRFPGDGSFYTAHKCILTLNKELVGKQKQEYEYCVGRSLIDGNPDPDHTSEIMQFTIYPKNTPMRIYQITDQQGFYWIEYLTWAGSAKMVYKKIKEDLKNDGDFIPVIINTGDMTQNGTRVNEWIDYYRGGYCLFKEFEHMSVVGNNDLCNTNPDELGTGDDYGKSNGYYFHVFQCFEVEDEELIVNNKYIPSTYYIECQSAEGKFEKLICVNSEITFINCRDWFGLGLGGLDENSAYNIYTGWLVGKDTPVEPVYSKTFTPIYNILYRWLQAAKDKPNTRVIAACHEMPFTVITNKNLKADSGTTEYSRSKDGSSLNLVGSHLNQITPNDNVANYWFSRLLEHFEVKLCIGGHKHTYTCTYPVREFYFYDKKLKNSLENGPMIMLPSLEDEYKNGEHKISWEYTKSTNDLLLKNNNGKFNTNTKPFDSFIPDNVKFNTSKLPIVKFSGEVYKITTAEGNLEELSSQEKYNNSELGLSAPYLPIIGDSDLTKGVTYFMCLATGYKQTSNKELPSSAQAFTQLLPLTMFQNGKDVASRHQLAPMFGIIKLDPTSISIQLARIMNIQFDLKVKLYNNIKEYSVDEPYIEFINSDCDPNVNYIEHRYGTWSKKVANITVLN